MLGLRCFVYYNLHKHTWSIKALEGDNKGRVIAHSDYVTLTNAVGRVSEAGRQRVIREQRKNVHAGIVGYLASLDEPAGFYEAGRPITYNPYKYDSFVYLDTQEKFLYSGWATLANRKVFTGSSTTNPL